MKPGVAMFAVLLALTSSLALARKARPSKSFEQLANVPEDARARANPLANDADADAVAAGRKLYERHCASCHGASGENGRKGPGLTGSEIRNATAGELFWVITNGNVRAGMPVWSKLPEPQRWQITTYLKSLGQLPSAPPEPGRAQGR
jgi:mono/diheme cytochrome c family protein